VYHVIEFVVDWWAEVERAPGQPVVQMLIPRGTKKAVSLRPRIVESGEGPMEVADLGFEDRSTVRGVPFATFVFAD
jgi:hypothetical protein